jgi:phosphomannomutase
VFRTPVGESNVTEGMVRHKAVIGGEGNGGVIYPRINFARDSLVGMALALHRLADSGRTVSQLVDALPRLEIVKTQFPFPSQRLGEMFRRARREYAAYPQDLRDGVKVTLPDAWFLLRGSNTEPVMRVVAEATDAATATALAHQVRQKIESWLKG